MSAPSVLVLEATWVPGLEPAPSVRPFLEGWAAHQGLAICCRNFGSCIELSHWLRHFLASDSLSVAYVAAHGRSGSLHTPTSEIPLQEVAQAITSARRRRRVGKGIVFGACHLGSALDTFLAQSNQKFDWALGYTESIPWLGATVSDLLFLEYLFAGIAQRSDGAQTSHLEEAEAAAWLVGEHCRLAKLMGLRLARVTASARAPRWPASAITPPTLLHPKPATRRSEVHHEQC